MRRGALLFGLILICAITALPAAAMAAGKIAFVTTQHADEQISLMNLDGSGPQAITPDDTENDRSPAWSPDGKQILFTSDRGADNDNIWVMNADGSGARPLTSSGESELNSDWSPDGSKIVFTKQFDSYQLWIMNADGSGQAPLVDLSPTSAYGAHFSPDGQWIVFTRDGPGPGVDDPAALIKPDGSGFRVLTPGLEAVYSPDFTADGKRITFWNESDGDREVYSMAADGTDVRNLTNTPSIGPDTDNDFGPAPSWDGLNRIAFSSNRSSSQEIWLMNADGSGPTQLTDTSGINRSPAFQPTLSCRGKVATIVGTPADETLTGGPAADVIVGGGGKDTINGLDGKDVICGEAGKDRLNGGKGKDQLDGGTGKDKLNGGKGKDTCAGGKGHDSGKACEKEKKIP